MFFAFTYSCCLFVTLFDFLSEQLFFVSCFQFGSFKSYKVLRVRLREQREKRFFKCVLLI